MTQTADLEAPPEAQPLKENHADEATTKLLSRRQADRKRIETFARLWASPGPAQYHATKSAEMAGYSKKTAASQGSRLLKRPDVRELIDTIQAETHEKLTSDLVNAKVDTDFVVHQCLVGLAGCRATGDRTNEREYIKVLGQTCGAFDASLHLDLTVKHEYDERLALEASRLARLALEEAGDRGLGLPAGVVEVQVHDVALEALADHDGDGHAPADVVDD